MSDILPLELVFPFVFMAFVVGACFGSFLNVCVARWPDGRSVVSPPSSCPACNRQIRWFENVPIFGWIFLRGKCAGCSGRISVQYPAVELLVALIWAFSILVFGPSFEAIRVAVATTILLGIALTDAQFYLIPDGFTVTGFVFALCTAFAAAYWGMESELFAGPWDAVIGACAGAGVIRIMGWLGEIILKREAMGFGDETLMAFVGAMLGPAKSLLTVFGGAVLGAILFLFIVGPIVWIRSKRMGKEFEFPEVPFGVFLAPAALIVLLWGDPLISWYLEKTLGL